MYLQESQVVYRSFIIRMRTHGSSCFVKMVQSLFIYAHLHQHIRARICQMSNDLSVVLCCVVLCCVVLCCVVLCCVVLCCVVLCCVVLFNHCLYWKFNLYS